MTVGVGSGGNEDDFTAESAESAEMMLSLRAKRALDPMYRLRHAVAWRDISAFSAVQISF